MMRLLEAVDYGLLPAESEEVNEFSCHLLLLSEGVHQSCELHAVLQFLSNPFKHPPEELGCYLASLAFTLCECLKWLCMPKS